MTTIKYEIRKATVDDAPVIAHHRVSMFRDMGQVPTESLAASLLQAATTALAERLGDGSYVGWLAVGETNRVLAGAGAQVHTHLPRISHDGTSITKAPAPLVVNVYTETDVRGLGLARALMDTLLMWASDQGFDRVNLHASDAGRHLYESLGFVATNEMRWSPTQKRPPQAR